ncbi:unnamed protein product [Cuscuta campestris]|uniref:Major facilitator superfamily (MFS) profile domain-containing protein n=1 Tax=Cuscuta campestris TaxID=132261 RepID=A0A484MC90_9ASTE|nr:unnamed protein product [Cuscuta campestris]
METTMEEKSSMEVEQQLIKEVSSSSSSSSSSIWKMVAVASIATGLQFGWALQFSLLTPYVQLLGVPHKFASFMWLCGPISGIVVQPLAGHYSDNCTSRFGRRRPFIASGALLVVLAVFLIGFAADIGHAAGDRLGKTTKPRAITVFVIGFWTLDVANNTLQGPCRALLADLSGDSAEKMRVANALFSFFSAIGSVLGYAAGSYSSLHKIFPFTKTKACDIYCANLKSCFFISISLLLVVTAIALICIKEHVMEKDIRKESKKTKVPFFGDLFLALKDLPRAMWLLLLVCALNSVAWFPFLLYDTDWMAKEVYGGKVGNILYNKGVHAGALGLMLNSVVAGVISIMLELMARQLGGVKKLWAGSNLILATCLAMTVLVTKMALRSRRYNPNGDILPPPAGVKAGAFLIFSTLGIPSAATLTIPYALVSIFTNKAGAGQGLSVGILNLSFVIPQMLVSFMSGPWDALFGGGNLPAFLVGAVSAATSGILIITLLPSPSPDDK